MRIEKFNQSKFNYQGIEKLPINLIFSPFSFITIILISLCKIAFQYQELSTHSIMRMLTRFFYPYPLIQSCPTSISFYDDYNERPTNFFVFPFEIIKKPHFLFRKHSKPIYNFIRTGDLDLFFVVLI